MAEESHHRGERKNSLERYVPKHRPEYSREYSHEDQNNGLDNLMDNMSLGGGRPGRGRRPDGGRVRGGRGRVQGGWNDNRRGGGGWSRGHNDRGRGGWGGVGDYRDGRNHDDAGRARRDEWNEDRNGGSHADTRGGRNGGSSDDSRGSRNGGSHDGSRGGRKGGLYEDGKGGWSEHPTGPPQNDNVNRRSNNDGFDDHMAAKKEKMTNSNNYPYQANGNLPKPKKNTENFNPCHAPMEMRILMAQPGLAKYNRDYTNRDVLMVSDLFCQPEDLSIYNSLLKEIEESGISQSQLFKLWHGDSHVIADDKLNWKEACPTFLMVLDKVTDYFGMEIKATRMNWYRDSKEWKPFHHDAAAVKADKARNQNFTVAVSFGEERDAAFEHAKTKTKISMPQPNGTLYTFGRDINILWRHGILQVPPEKYVEKGRISIIAWGWIPQTEL